MPEIQWIKITTTMFDNEKLKLIDAMPERDTIFYIWIRLLVQAGKTNAAGYIFLNEKIPYTEEMLSTLFNRQIQSVRLALGTLKSFGMIEISENKLILISNWGKYQNVEGMEKVREQNRIRKQKQRHLEKLVSSGVDAENGRAEAAGGVKSRDSHAAEGEVDKEEDKEKEFTTAPADVDYLKFFNSNFHTATEHEINVLANYEKKGMKPEIIVLALKEAVENSVRDLSYVMKILDRWLEEKILTVDAVLEDKAKYKRNKSSSRDINKNSSSKYSTFNNFQQRDYDFDSLEKKLLGW